MIAVTPSQFAWELLRQRQQEIQAAAHQHQTPYPSRRPTHLAHRRQRRQNADARDQW